MQGFLRTPRYAAILEVKDPAAFAKMLDGAVSKTQAYFRDRFEANTKPPPVRIHPLKGMATAYSVSISPSVAPVPAGFGRPYLGEEVAHFCQQPGGCPSDPGVAGAACPAAGLGSAGFPWADSPAARSWRA